MQRAVFVVLAAMILPCGCGAARNRRALACSQVLVQMSAFANDLGRLAATPEGPATEDRLHADTDILKAELTELHGEGSGPYEQSGLRRYRTVLSRFELAIEVAATGRRSADLADPTAFAHEIGALNTRVRTTCR